MAFPDDRDRELQRDSWRALEFADELVEWVGENNAERQKKDLGAIRPNDEFRLLTLRRQAANLSRSSTVPVAAAVYGPSQVGKSLFVGRVVQPQDEQFSPLGRDERLGPPAYEQNLSFDFDLNPRCGAQEATAIVTRFTTKDRFEPTALQDYPVLVRALSRSEWIRVLARGFRSECKMSPDEIWSDSELESLFVEVAKDFSGSGVDRNWRMDFLDAFSYLKRIDALRFQSDASTFNGLVSRYPLTHDGYVEIAARLSWDGWPEITSSFNRICQFLVKLQDAGHDGMLIHWAAVRFLLDSQRNDVHVSENSKCFAIEKQGDKLVSKVAWGDLVDKVEGDWYVLDYQPGAGPPKEDLNVIQSAMLEMVIPVIPERINGDWRQVLEHIDFLDIPGMLAEGKGEAGGTKAKIEKEEDLADIVKRGKVFYLFDRYIEELQAQTLLMLFRGGSLQVRGFLKEYVDKWGESRYGKGFWPEKVREDPPALFVGMTGIDEEFDNEQAKKQLYDARLRQIASSFGKVMQHFGGKDHPFQNVYPIRYPGTWDKDATRRKGREQEWEIARQAFLDSESVETHVENAEQKWDAAMRDGDGGVSLLAPAFRQTTSALKKQDELKSRIVDTYGQLQELAESWVIDPDANLDRERRVAVAKQVTVWIEAVPNSIYWRVQGLQASLCFQPGDVFYLADLADARKSSRGPRDDLEARFPEELQSFLHDWGTAWAPERWREYASGHDDDDDGWLEPDVFGAMSRYLAEYLCTEEVFRDLCDRLMKVIALHVPDEGAKRQSRRKYFRLILNDYVMNPGPNGNTLPEISESDVENFGLMASFVNRWRTRLPEALAAGGCGEVGIPHGNVELIELLEQFV